MTAATLFKSFARTMRSATRTSALTIVVMLTAGLSGALAAVDMNISQFIDSPDPVPAGGFVTYDIKVENSGVDPTATNATMKFRLPPGTIFQSVAPSSECTFAAGPSPQEVNCDFGIMQGTLVDPNAFRMIQIVVRTTTPGVIQAFAAVLPTDGNATNNTLDVNTTVANGADLRFQSFVAAPDPVTAGGIAAYTVRVENLGPNSAAGLSITFNIPPGLQYDSFSSAGGWSCSPSGAQLTCSNGATVAVGGLAPTLVWNAKVTAAVVGSLTTLGTVSSATGDGNLTNNTSTADVTVAQGTDLSIAKTVSSDPVIGGTAMTFNLNVTNNGPFPASTVQVTDTLPAGFTGISAAGAGWLCGVAVDTVTCTRTTLAVGSAPIVISATAPPNASIAVGGQNVSNTAQVQSATADAISANDQSTVNFRLVRDGADLRIAMSRGPTPVPFNSDITTTLRSNNQGPRVATGPIRIAYQLAVGEFLQSFSGTDWTCSPLATPGALVTCNRLAIVGGLAVGASTNPLTLATRTTTAGTVLGTACTSATAGLAPIEGDIDTSNDCITNDGSVTASATTADLMLSKAVAPGTLVSASGQITYTLVVTNNGPDSATNVTLTDPIPMYSPAFGGRAATTVNANVAGGTGGTCTGTSTLSCNLGTVLVGTPKTVTVTVDRPMQSGSFRNNADVFSSTIGDSNRANNAAFADVVIEAVTDIELTSKTVAPALVKSGVEATYVITLRNNGPSPAANVVVTDKFSATGGPAPGNGTYSFISASATNGGTCPTAPTAGISAAFDIVCNFGTVEPFGVRSMTVKIRPDFMVSAPAGRQFQNEAQVNTTTPQQTPDPTLNFRSAVLDVEADLIDLLIEETDLSDPVGYSPGSPTTNVIVYQVNVTNRGPSYATGVRFTDATTPPTGKALTFMCDRATAPPTPFNTGTACPAPSPICTGSYPLVTCTIGDMAASTSTTRFLVYRVDTSPEPVGDTFVKEATVTGNETETLTTNNRDPEQTTVRMLADVQLVSKTAVPATVSINQPFNWTIVGRNNGPGTAVNTRFADTLPPGMELFPTVTMPAIAVSGGTGTPCAITSGSTSFTCPVGDIANAATVTLTVPVRMSAYPSGGISTNTSRVDTDSIDVVPGNNSNTGPVTITRSSLACTVFHDVNDDGIKQATEPGIAGTNNIRLSGTDAYGNTITRTASTNGAGVCLFNNLPPSDTTGYMLTETQPAGYVDGQDNKDSIVIVGSKTTDTITGIVLSAATDIAADRNTFGELLLASIGGRVWHDANNDALIGGTEAQRIDGVTITLTGSNDQGPITPLVQATSGGGIYSFPNLRPGTYTLTQTQPGAPWLEGQAAVGTGITGASIGTADNALASATFGNVISNIQIQSGNAGVDYNFGEVRPAQVAGIVWYDGDNNGARNGIEPIIAGVTVTLDGTDYRGVTVAAQSMPTAAVTGAYSFTNLKPGTYRIRETQPTDYVDGQTKLGTVGGAPVGTAGTNEFTAVVLPSDGAGVTYDFGELGRGLTGFVYVDVNDDGIKQGAETGIPNASVRISGCGIDRTMLTDGMGAYTFSGLPACPTGYTLNETTPAGFSDGKDTAGTALGTVTNDQITGIVLTRNVFETGYNFGEFGVVATDVTCTAAVSPNPTTARNIREPFNWTFRVQIASGGAAPAVKFADTLPAGLELTAVPFFRLDPAGAPTNCTGLATQTSFMCNIGYMTPGQVYTVTAPVRALSFPTAGTLTNSGSLMTEGTDTVNNTCQSNATIQQASLAGTVFEDPNNNGTRETGENGIGNTTLTLTGRDLYNNPVSVTTTTVATPGPTIGTYLFNGLAPSDAAGYTVTETQPNGYADGKDTAGSKGGNATVNDIISAIPLLPAENATAYNFAEIGQGIAGSVYVDSNNNGIRDSGEQGIANVTIRVTGASSTNALVDQTAITDNQGNYLFGNLPASNATGYTIVETQPAAWADGQDRLGTLSGTLANDRFTRVVLPGGVVGTGYDFGEVGGRLCGYVYNDRNDNGTKDRTEAGIPGATVTLVGLDINGDPVNRVGITAATGAGADLGRYCVTDLPLPGPGGYTLAETQPADTADGRDTVGIIGGRPVGTGGNDVISVINPTTPGFTGENYNFGERITNAAAVSGFVWFDNNHDRVRDPTGRGGWTVELISGVPGGPSTVIASVVTNPDGSYRFEGLPPGPGYAIQFRSPQGNYIYGFIPNVTLTANTELTEQNQPIDPSGVVYDSLTRQAVPGAVVRIEGPAGFDPATHLVGGPGNVAQTTDATGEYKYLLLPGAPTGTYRLLVNVPTGYVQRVSTAIPACVNTLTVGPTPNPALVQTSDRAPTLGATTVHNPNTCAASSSGLGAGASTTQYYLALALSATSANVINNHIPVERLPTTDALVVTKTTPRADVSRGELVPYTITVRNNVDQRQTDIAIQDQIPPGFQYRVGSATVDNLRREPVTNGRLLSWAPLVIERNQLVTVRLLLVVGSGVGTGEFVNQAWAANQFTGSIVSNVAKATVRIVPDATFDCSEVIGKVFDDKNRNGIQEDGEAGLANVRVVTVRGQLVTTDAYGRFHIACADIPDEDRGSNYVLKLDERTLPTGYRLTTENPGLVRLTRGKMSKINFGASIQRVVRIDLKDQAFEPGSTVLRQQFATNLDQLLPVLQEQQSVLRIAYGRGQGEDAKLAQSRMNDVAQAVRAAWRQHGGGYPLSIETEVYQSGGGK